MERQRTDADAPAAIALAWQDAVNKRDIDYLLELSHPEIEVVGPRGSGYGHQLLRDWLGRAGLSLTTRRVFARGDEVVVAQHAIWRSVETGEALGEADIASRFRIRGRRVAMFARFDSLDAALAAAGLAAADETPQQS
jgi:hypothetical protein